MQNDQRVQQLVKTAKGGRCVLYVMSRDQRTRDNFALTAAQDRAIEKGLPLAVVFCLRPSVGMRSREHYEFMLDGLRVVEKNLRALTIPFLMVIGEPKERLDAVIHHVHPEAIFFDCNPLRGPRSLMQKITAQKQCNVFLVDTHNIVPVWAASDKKEVAAYTLRPKLHRLLGNYLIEPRQAVQHPHSWPGRVQTMASMAPLIDELLKSVSSSGIKPQCKSGEDHALQHLETFARGRLHSYAADRNLPDKDSGSGLSPYVHFGHIHSLRVALRLREIALQHNQELHLLQSPKMPQSSQPATLADGINALLEELIVRKELSDNFCWYEPQYDSLTGASSWAVQTLQKHQKDPRDFLYSYDQLKDAQTHDAAWNASQLQMRRTGKMHGYMRMYWAKKVLEWTENPEQAIEFLIKLNDTYSIDGGDPNGYVGIMWSVAGVHDRPWTERPVFGQIRYMNYAGLRRKFDITQYERQWS